MTAADSQTPASPVSLGLLDPVEPLAVEYPPDCIIWAPDVIDGFVDFDGRHSSEERGSDRHWIRSVVVRPASTQKSAVRQTARHHDRVVMFLLSGGETFRFGLARAKGTPRMRFRDLGPRAVLMIYENDRVTRMAAKLSNVFTHDIPYINGTVVVATWSSLEKADRHRHVVVVPSLDINWRGRK